MSQASTTERSEHLFELLVESLPDVAVCALDPDGQVLSWNGAAARMTGFDEAEAVGKHWSFTFPKGTAGDGETEAEAERLLRTATEEGRAQAEVSQVRKDGSRFQAEVTLTALRDEEAEPIGFAEVIRELTGREEREAAGHESEENFRALAENAANAIVVIDEESTILFANPAVERIFGYRPEDLRGESLTTLMPERLRAQHLKGFQRYLATGKRHIPWNGFELPGLTSDGREIPIEVSFGEHQREGRHFFSGIINDISERKRIEEELRASVQRLHLLVEQTPLGAIDLDPDHKVVAWNPAAERIFGHTAEEAIGSHISFIFPEEARGQLDEVLAQLVAQQGGERSSMECVTRDGRSIHCEWYNTALVDASGKVIGVASLVEDITERKLAEVQSRRQVEHLNALRAIDLAITASMDLRVTLTVLLDQVVSQLRVHATDILLLNPFTQRLEFSAGRGFRTEGIQRSEILLGECSAGRAALDRRTTSVPNLQTSPQFTRAALLPGEEFVAHYSTPLIAKGKVVGVLEVFHRSPLHPSADWIGFLEALAGQAAIAVESARLFEELQRSNLELALAYDTTLEGWAHALDLRDSVTEGHTRRVTEMTMRLARALGVEDADLMHMRRGALLHDIGKMGIPDGILHKKGALSDEEWTIMRKHPVYAFELLSPIEFLLPALDIPYAHHEHWDGSGYPRGLKGEEIPLAARIFAVVDVWDALRSDRPYHDAWTEEKACEHIRSLAGSHLDPQVVEIFLSLDW